MDNRTLYTTAEAAGQLGIAPGTLRNAIQRKRLHVVQINPRLHLIEASEIERYRHEILGQRGGYRPRRKT